MALSPGMRLGPYEVVELLGAGGMGEVYRARDPRLGRDVAVKVLPAEVAGDAQRLNFFEREARAVAALNHPNILTVHDVGTHEGLPYVVTELLEGESFREIASRRTPTVQQILGYALQAARGLEAAHLKDIVHRDLKPENLFLTTDGRVKVLDFGLAKLVRQEAMTTDAPTPSRSTAAGQVVGTVAYMSPEQARGQPVDPRSDVFSFGVVLYELLGGTHPFHRETMAATLTAIVEKTPADLESSNRGIHPAVGGIVRRCLEKSKEDRYGSGHDVAVALEAVLAAPTGAAALLEVEERSPYPGLSSFMEKDAGVFFGREREVEELWGRIRNRKLLAVIGPSGVGKTSFVRAGVVAGRPEGWAAIVCTLGTAPSRGLGQALGPELAGDTEALGKLAGFEDPDTALELIRRWRRDHGEALLVVDQFEELFTLNPPEVQERFASLLGRLAGEADVHVLLSLRDDFLIRCHEQPALARVFEHLTPLLGLSAEGLRRALVEPAKKQGYNFDDETLVEEMVSLVEGVRGALPLLAFAAARLWEKRDREGKLLTREAYREIAGVEGALAQHAEATMDRIGSERQGLVRELFRNLVTAQGTRAVIDRDELLSALPDRTAAEEVLRELIDARLLTSYDVEGKEDDPTHHRIEIVHESLLKAWPRLVRWQTQDEDSAQLRDQLRQAARLWDERGRSADLLWSGAAYREFEVWRERYPGGLTETEDAFARSMATHAERKRRRRRRAVAAVIAGLVAGFGVMSGLWRRAVTEARRAEASKLVAIGRMEIDRYPSATLAYARRSLELSDTLEGRRLALEALWRGPTARILPLEVASWGAEFSPDGRWLASFPSSENVLLFPDDGGPPRVFGGHAAPAAPPGLAFTADGNALLTQTPGDPRVRMLSVPLGRELRWLAPNLPGGDPEAFCGLDWVTKGPLFCVRDITEPDPIVRLELVPHDGGPSRVVGSLLRPPSVPYLPDHSGSRLVLARGERILVRPLAGPATTPEREVARIERGGWAWPLFSPRGDSVAVAQDDGRLTLWPLDQRLDVRPARHVLRMENPDVQFLPTFDARSSRIAWGSSAKRSVSLWRLDGPPDADPIVLRRGAVTQTKQGVFHPKGDWLAVANQESLTFWAVNRPQPFVLRGHESNVTNVRFTPDSKWLASCGYQADSVRLWPLDPEAGTLQTIGYAEVVLCNGLTVGPDGEQLLVGGAGGARVIPLTGGEPQQLTGRPPDGGIYGVAFDASGRRVAASTYYSSGAPKKLRVWDLDSDAPPRELPLIPSGQGGKEYDWGVYQLAFTPRGDLLAAGKGGIRRFKLGAGTESSVWVWELDLRWQASMGLSRDGQLMIARARPSDAIGPEDHQLALFDLAAGTRRSITTHGNRVEAVALDPTGEVIVTGDASGAVRVGPADGGEPHLLLGHTDAVNWLNNVLAVSPDGRWIASAAGDEIRLWPMPDLAKPPLHTLPLDELLARLHDLTNVRVVADEASPAGYTIDIGPFPGWRDVPTW